MFFKEKLMNNQKVITCELFPPKGTDLTIIKKKILLLKDFVDAINVTDNQRAVMRISPLSISHILTDYSVEPIFQMTCRDRNRLAIQSDLLSASVLNIKNVLVLTGDDIKNGDHPEAKQVYDIDVIQLIQTMGKMNKGMDYNNNALEGATDFFIGGAVNPIKTQEKYQYYSFKKKIDTGVQFFQTQISFDISEFERVKKWADDAHVKIIGSVLLLKSMKMIERMKLLGIDIPEKIVSQLNNSENFLETAKQVCADQVRQLSKFMDGVHIIAINSEETIPDIITRARK